MTKLVSVGIHVPTSAVAPLGSGEAYAEFFRHVEALGLDAVWTEDRVLGVPTLDIAHLQRVAEEVAPAVRDWSAAR